MDTGGCGVDVKFIVLAVRCVEVVGAGGTTSSVGSWKSGCPDPEGLMEDRVKGGGS